MGKSHRKGKKMNSQFVLFLIAIGVCTAATIMLINAIINSNLRYGIVALILANAALYFGGASIDADPTKVGTIMNLVVGMVFLIYGLASEKIPSGRYWSYGIGLTVSSVVGIMMG